MISKEFIQEHSKDVMAKKIVSQYKQAIEDRLDIKITVALNNCETWCDISDYDMNVSPKHYELFSQALKEVIDKYKSEGYKTNISVFCGSYPIGATFSWEDMT